MVKKVTVRFIIQIAGKPQEKVTEALNMVLEKLGEETDRFKVVESHLDEPILDKESSLYTGFIEVSAKFLEVRFVLDFILDYTPTSIEVEDPAKLELNNNDFTNILNDMSNNLLNMQNKLRNLNAYAHMQNKKIEELGGSTKSKK